MSDGWPNFSPQPAIILDDNVPIPVGKQTVSPNAKVPRIRLNTVAQIAAELKVLYREARGGKIATSEASKLAFLLNMLTNIISASEIEERLTNLERRQ